MQTIYWYMHVNTSLPQELWLQFQSTITNIFPLLS